MRLIGLTGSIGSGKSAVASLLRELGAVVLDADVLAREGAVALQPVICEAFPQACNAGVLDRAALGRMVFADIEARKRLEAILHPYVRARMAEATEAARAEGKALAVQDIPLLFETGQEGRFDGILVVTAPTEVRRQRVMARSGLSQEEFSRRDANQMPQAEKVQKATWVVENAGSLEDLRDKIQAWYRELK